MEEPVILFEDNHLLVAVKPQNIPTQADSSGDRDFLTVLKDYIKEKYQKPGNVFLGLVHRLDRPAGGVMVFAKTSKAAARLSEQIRGGEAEKRYLAVICGKPRDKRGRLVNYLIKDETKNVVRIAPALIEGAKRAELDYFILESTDKLSLADVKLITGRGHQIRAQMMGQGCPLYGDVKYGATEGRGQNLALWAYSLKIRHPITDKVMVFKVFPPETAPWKYFAVAKHINVVKPE